MTKCLLLLFLTLSGQISVFAQSLESPYKTITLLFTNDFESAYDPTEAFWKPDINRIGGIAHIASLIDSIRSNREQVYLFDSGDIFTGTLSKLTKGVLPFELMITMGYDAMCVGNHEFEYGWETFAEVKSRAPFPVLGANLYYKGTDIHYAQPYTIIERQGIRLGVIGILGQDAATALIPSNIAGIDVKDPVSATSKYVGLLRDQVDLIVLLTHQGKTAPMQTNDEDPEVKRDIQADITLAGAVEGIDVLLGGHADAGTEKPYIHPETGTIIMQTYGQGYYLGYLEIVLDTLINSKISHQGYLIPVISDDLAPHPLITNKLRQFRSRYPEIYHKVGENEVRLNRSYNKESEVGNLFADVLREVTSSDMGMISPGAIRKDLPQGTLLKRDVLDAFPFTDKVYQLQMDGSQIKDILEQSMTLERGMLQVSGMTVIYDLHDAPGNRVKEVKIGKRKLREDALYTVGTVEILAQGGDAFTPFAKAKTLKIWDQTFSEILLNYISHRETLTRPPGSRLIPVKK